MTLGMYAGFGRNDTLEYPGLNCIHDGCTDKACKSPTRLAEVSAKSSAVLSESIFAPTPNKGSNGGPDKASKTSGKSHPGDNDFDTGRKRRAPRMKRQTRGCCPTVLPFKPR